MLANKAAASAAQHAGSLRRFGEEVPAVREDWLSRVRRWFLLHCGRVQGVKWLERQQCRENRVLLAEMLDLRDSLRKVTRR